MNKITFGFRKANCSMSNKLVICHEKKIYERGQCCINSDYVDVFVKLSDLDKIEKDLIANGYVRKDEHWS